MSVATEPLLTLFYVTYYSKWFNTIGYRRWCGSYIQLQSSNREWLYLHLQLLLHILKVWWYNMHNVMSLCSVHCGYTYGSAITVFKGDVMIDIMPALSIVHMCVIVVFKCIPSKNIHAHVCTHITVCVCYVHLTYIPWWLHYCCTKLVLQCCSGSNNLCLLIHIK